MKLSNRITNFAGAAAIALSMGTMADAEANGGGHNPPGYGDNPTTTTGCNGQPGCGGTTNPGGDTTVNTNVTNTNTNTNVNDNTNTNTNVNDNTNTNNNNSNANSNSSVNIKNPRQVGNAPAAIAYANARCQTGFGVSIGTIFATGGISMTKTDYKCMDYDTAQFLVDSGLRLGRNEVALLGLATFNNISANIKMSTQQVADGYRRCGKAAMENNLVIGTDIAVNGAACPKSEPKIARVYNMKAPKIVHKKDADDCAAVVEKARICVAKNPGLKF